ncbi:hypothetical protein ACJ73_01247 [Blastomyces percursus]|uniref:Uncharacterized protein n=1 Tax=Blastomyces percursus TaxID=1658174 RepID=A0A1J9R4R8_9EURO|nr:hypothetical protein ACJ73_01247 [Blastomyces percursus]
MSWRDQEDVGFYRKGQIESISKQLQSCKTTIDLIVGIANIVRNAYRLPGNDNIYIVMSRHSCIRHARVTDDIRKAISSRQIQVSALSASRKLLDELLVKVKPWP